MTLYSDSLLQSYTDYKVGVDVAGTYRVALDTDSSEFDGHGRVDVESKFITSPGDWDGRSHSLMVYAPSRSALVLSRRINEQTH